MTGEQPRPCILIIGRAAPAAHYIRQLSLKYHNRNLALVPPHVFVLITCNPPEPMKFTDMFIVRQKVQQAQNEGKLPDDFDDIVLPPVLAPVVILNSSCWALTLGRPVGTTQMSQLGWCGCTEIMVCLSHCS